MPLVERNSHWNDTSELRDYGGLERVITKPQRFKDGKTNLEMG